MKTVAIITLEGFNEIDSLLAFSMLNRLNNEGLEAKIVSDRTQVTSMNGLVVAAQDDLANLASYNAVLFGSGCKTSEHLTNSALMASFRFTSKQLIASQCSGARYLHSLSLLPENLTVATDSKTAKWFSQQNQPTSPQSFSAQGNVATAGGCLAAEYLAAWLANKLLNEQAMETMLAQVIPMDEPERMDRARALVG